MRPTPASSILSALLLLVALTALLVPNPAAAMPDTTVQGFAWNDGNCDGIRQDGESPIEALPVNLFAAGADNQINTVDDQVVSVSGTGPTGMFAFDLGITGVDYALVILPRSRPIRLIPGPLNAGTDRSRDNDMSAGIWATNGFQMSAAQTVTGIDIGLCVNPNIRQVYLPLAVR
jgi:SdrD B-like protein